ncbi:MAG TPA: FG-GAP-like repeat-containing protein, partial [Verrucomicrobiae bacterium]
SVAHPFPNCYVGAVAWADYNNDGKLDILISGATTGGGLVANLWRNEGNGTFTHSGANLPGTDLGFAAWGDYDNDGDLDLLFGGNSNEGRIARIYRNDGGTFTNINAGLLPVIWSSAAWGDFDNDGKLDAMIMGYDPVAQVPVSRLYRNVGGNTFSDSGQAFHNLYLGTLIWADYDNDGNLDLVLAGNDAGADLLILYHNNNPVTNTAPGAPAGLVATNFGPSIIFDWTAAADAQTPAAGLNYNLRVGTAPGAADILSPESGTNGTRRLAALGNTGSRLTAQLNNLRPGTNYYWSVQAIDSAFAGGPFAVESSFFLAAPSAPHLLSAQPGTNGFRIEASGSPGWSYGIEATTNFNAPAWAQLGSGTADNSGKFVFTDTNAASHQRFYRALYP